MMYENKPKYFDDEGTEINPDLIPKPDLCITCNKDKQSGSEWGCATGAQQILTQHMARCHARSVDKVGCNSKVKAVRCVETCVPRQDHNLMFAHPAGQPVGQCRTAEIVKFTPFA